MSLSAAVLQMLPTEIPSPTQSVWYLGPFPLRAYAMAIMVGIVMAIIITQRRWQARGGDPEQILEIAFWAVPFGILGGRLYHVISSPDRYFGVNGDPVKALFIWEGGLGIWGAVALGGVGAWIGCRRQGVKFSAYADALAPGLLVAQAIGRLGNWFNQELFGGPTTLPWGLRIDPLSAGFPPDYPADTLFHPTFLYEMLWNLAGAGLLVLLERRFRLGHGRLFWLYVMVYTTGRLWIEMLRIDPAHTIFGVRLNVWTSVLVFLVALVAFVLVGRRHPGRETTVLAAVREDEAHDAEPEPEPDEGSFGPNEPGSDQT
jgi:prolipoprotein diacylglyceryl transferase